ncbi:hypothetical protein ACFVX9_24280 [Kitasatospora sp. NPDC058243]|uniref:hypothetical protein n=1 Tax=Kitasatospora sp. NPDC058243 TaxID=3346397 RepID=UPI0036D8DF3F
MASLPAEADTSVLLGLARALSHLSDAAWRTYPHPVSAAGSLEPNSEGWRRDEEGKHFSEVTDAIAKPNLPRYGSMIVSYSPLIESANRVGRALHDIDDPDLTKAVLAEAATEVAVVESAELGDLAGRAQQAVLLSREDASPVQVSAADRLLEQNPFGPAELFSSVDPTAAAVATAHWLAAAAEVTADASGRDAVDVVQEADNIEALPHETPTLVLGLIDAGATPHEAVTGLVRHALHALHVADGLLPDPTALREQLDDLEETLVDYGDNAPDLADVELRLPPLDPKRPARDLLEDLLTGIHACWLLHTEYDDLDDEDDDTSAEDWTAEQAEKHQRRSRERFAQLVRENAAHREPLV